MSTHGCGAQVYYIMPKAMGVGSIAVDTTPNQHPAADSDVWARFLSGAGLYETRPSSAGAARYRRHECPSPDTPVRRSA